MGSVARRRGTQAEPAHRTIRYHLWICQCPCPETQNGWQIEIRSSESAMIWIPALRRLAPVVGGVGSCEGNRLLRDVWSGMLHGDGHIRDASHRRTGIIPRKEVIQPHLPIRLPCYDLVPLTASTFGAPPLAVGTTTSGENNSGGLTGGVYKARERIHRSLADLRLLAIPASCRRVAACNPN